jgi:hypothetical protein
MVNLADIKEVKDRLLLELDTVEEILKHYDKKGVKGTSS